MPLTLLPERKQPRTQKPTRVHGIHPYFAKFQPNIPGDAIEAFTSPADVVLDPYCGSGTSLVEALRLERNAIGVDANPLACLISRVKVHRITAVQWRNIDRHLLLIERAIQDLHADRIRPDDYSVELPHVVNFETWFEPHVIKELTIIRSLIDHVSAPRLRDFLDLSLSRIIVSVSNQDTESRYTRVKKHIARGHPFRLFAQTVKSMRESLEEFHVSIPSNVVARIFNHDTRHINFIKKGSVDLIVTSPPYLNSWDYALYNRFRFVWLRHEIRHYEEVEIGKHLRTLRNGAKELARYRADMQHCMGQFARVLRPGAHCCIVNADSVVDGRLVGTNQVLIDAGNSVGLKLIKTRELKVLGPHFGMNASKRTKGLRGVRNVDKQEKLLLFKR